jgi:hypothetical protein
MPPSGLEVLEKWKQNGFLFLRIKLVPLPEN